MGRSHDEGRTYSALVSSLILAQLHTPTHFASPCASDVWASAADTVEGPSGSAAVVDTDVGVTVTTVVSTRVMTRGDAEEVEVEDEDDDEDDDGDGDDDDDDTVASGGTGTTMTETTLEAVTVYVPGAAVR